jgi:2-polyprenyl-3-methyl-5-hydroxy-6-metoxy-1,4-benzoquinol methylase
MSLAFNNHAEEILDLGMHAFADTFIPLDKLDSTEPILPLACLLDPLTGMINNKIITLDYDRYNLYEYSYTSSNSNFARSHWQDFAKFIHNLIQNKNSNIMEIGANDGFLCSLLKNYNHDVLAIDSSKLMTELCQQKGINSTNMVFSLESVENSNLTEKNYECIIANNVFNHSNDPLDFLLAVKRVITKDGYFVFEVPYWLNLVESLHFDQIYHEHISYFTIFSLKNLLSLANFEIVDFEVIDYHGGSLRIISKIKSDATNVNTKKIEDQISLEKKIGLFEKKTYIEFEQKIKNKRSKFLANLHNLKAVNSGIPFVGVGAAAKANTLLTYYGMNSTYIDFITDMSEFKIGKFTPLTRIPILSDQAFQNSDYFYAIILSWNISDTLKKSILNINRNVRFLDL